MLDINYYSKLKQQYISAEGIKCQDVQPEEVIAWTYENQNNAERYQMSLVLNSIFYGDSEYLELGKGTLDTIVSENDATLISSNFDYTFNKDYFKDRLFSDNIRFGLCPYILKENKNTRSFGTYKLDKTKFITQNVYGNNFDLVKTISAYDNEIIVGAFGNINDKDRLHKIEQLRRLKNYLLKEGGKEYYSYMDDTYIYFIHRKPNKYKKKTLYYH